MSRFDDEELHELAAAYILDAVDDMERKAFEHHLLECARCQDEVASYDDAVTGLALSVSPVVPPPALKDALMADLASEEPSDPIEPAASSKGVSRRLLMAAAAAVAVLAVGGGLAVTQPWNEPTVVATIDGRSLVRNAPDAQQYEGNAGSARVVVTVSERAGRAVVDSEGMSAAPQGRTYQGWFLNGRGEPRSAGLLSAGQTQLLQGRPGAVFAITVEPTGGSAAPTTKPMVTVKLG